MLSIFLKYVYIIIVIISVLFWYIFLSPIYSSIQMTNSQISDTLTKLSVKEKEIQKIANLEKKMANLGKEVKAVLDMIPTKSLVKEYYLELEAMVIKIGTVISGVQVSDNGSGNTSFNLTFITSYDNFKELLNLIESEIRLTDIQTIGFSSQIISEINVGQNNYKGYGFALTGNSYYEP